MTQGKMVRAGLVAILVTSLVACSSSPKAPSAGAAGAKPGDFGTMKQVCHKADKPHKPNKDDGQGVTADSIKLTTISDAGSTIQPGLNQELWDSSTAFVNWCNANGGINGRTIKMIEGDAQLTQYGQVIDDACASSLALVGGGGAFDQLGQQARVKCGMPDFPSFVASSAAVGSDLVYQPLPLSNTTIDVSLMNYLGTQPGGVKDKVGYLYGDFATVKMTTDQVKYASVKLGWDFVQGQNYEGTYKAINQGSWLPIAQALKDKSVKHLVFNGQPPDLVKLLVALQAVNYTGLKWIFTKSNMYDKSLIDSAGKALDVTNVVMPLHIVPFELADARKPGTEAMQQYLDITKKYLPAPGGKVRALLGVQSFAAWRLFAQAANACGDVLNRECIEKNASKIHSFNAGGLTSGADPGRGGISSCYTGVEAKSDGFHILPIAGVDPIFSCNPKNVMSLAGTGFHAECNGVSYHVGDNRVSTTLPKCS